MTRITLGGRGPTGLRWPNYVNGRLLTATDLVAGRDAVLGRDRWLGLAIGPGVAEGLQVTGSSGSAEMRVSPGTGLCPGGIALHLDAPADLDLTVVSEAAAVDGALFSHCDPTTTTTQAPVAGAYLLVVRPASSYAEAVPVAASPTATLPTPCTSRWLVEDLEFAAIRLTGFTTETTAANRRNRLAAWCFGSDNVDDLAESGFTDPVPFRGLDGLTELTPCDLPLAVFSWDGAALDFVDQWSARRRPVRPSAAVPLAAVVEDGRAADGEARFLQFQDQLSASLATPAGTGLRAIDTFPLLPPAGLVPFDPVRAAILIQAMAAAPAAGTSPAISPAPSATSSSGGTIAAFVIGPSDSTSGANVLVGGGTTKLGALSEQILGLQQQVQVLMASIASGPGGPGPGGQVGGIEGHELADDLSVALADTPGSGVDLDQFFHQVNVRVGIVDRETVDFTVRRSWLDEAIDVAAGDVVNVFFVSSRRVVDGEEEETFAPYVLFAKRQRRIRWLDPGASQRWP